MSKSFLRLCLAAFIMMAAVFIGANIGLLHITKQGYSGRPYRVEAGRIALQIEEGTFVTPSDWTAYSSITGVTRLTEENAASFYDASDDYLMKEIDGRLYRFDYVAVNNRRSVFLAVNLCLSIAAVGIAALLGVVYHRILKPFDLLREYPYELAKGHLTRPLKASRDRYFGRFLWGLDLLRETLEQQRSRELALQSEKQTLVLSLSHDIKTPLGVMELYAKALQKGLYKDEQKKQEIAAAIGDKCEEIKDYIEQMIHMAHEDFLHLEVHNGEFYLSQVVQSLRVLYNEKLSLLHIPFAVAPYADCLLKGDAERAVEVLQNLMENAIKYGDGKEITLSFDIEETCVLVSVANTGCTLPENELPHIFDSFWRGSNVGSQKGSGLGLYICRRLMHQMKGDIFAVGRDGRMTVTVVFDMI